MKSDIWALGVMLFAMLCGFPPAGKALMSDPRYRMIASGQLPVLVESWNVADNLQNGALDLIVNILKPNPGERLTLQEIMEHRWVQHDLDIAMAPVAPPAPLPAPLHGATGNGADDNGNGTGTAAGGAAEIGH